MIPNTPGLPNPLTSDPFAGTPPVAPAPVVSAPVVPVPQAAASMVPTPVASVPATPAPVVPVPQTAAPVSPAPVSPAPVAPSSAVSPPAVNPAAAAPKPVPEPPVEMVFKLSPRESPDSILSEPGESDDEVFGSQGLNRMPIPKLPDPVVELPRPPVPVPSGPPVRPATSEQPPSYSPPATSNPFAFEDPPVPVVPPRPVAQPVPLGPASGPITPTVPTPTPPVNPWAGLEPLPASAPPASGGTTEPFEFDTRPAPQLVAVPATTSPVAPAVPRPVEAEPPPQPTQGQRPSAAEATTRPPLLLYGLATWAVLATLAAVYGLFFSGGEKVDPGHPLSVIPDTFGEFEPASRRKVSQFKFDVHQPLPANLLARLGQKIEVGQLQVEPVGIEKRRLIVKVDDKRGGGGSRSPGDALTLRLKVTNTSADLLIHPLDPAFNRKTTDKILTHLVVGKQTYYGGPVPWPFRTARVYEESQEHDADPLRPGETREYTVCSDTNSRLLAEVKKTREPILWRIQVRRGLIDFKGREVPVTAVIGVEFKSEEVVGL